MANCNVEFLTKSDKFCKLKNLRVISHNFHRKTKPGQDIFLQNFYDHNVGCISSWDYFHPFCEIVHGCEYPLVLDAGGRVYLSDKVQSPLHERIFDKNRD